MGVLEDLLSRATSGAFPGVVAPPVDPVDEAAQAEAARVAWADKLRRGQRRETPFGAPSVPFGALGAGMDLPASIAPPVAEASATVAPQFDGPIPMPRARPKEADGAPSEQPTDLSAAAITSPTNISAVPNSSLPPPPAPTAPEQPSTFGSLASGIMGGLKNNSATLLALGAGLAGAPNVGQGISRAAAAAIPASQADQKNRLVMQNQQQTLQALLNAKVPPNMALAALTNPEIMKAVSAKYLETKARVPHKIGTDLNGNDIMGSFDPNTGKYYGANNQELGASGTAGLPDAGGGLLAKGVTELNQELPADEFKAQFSPQVQAQMDAYIRGDTMPTGNPRLKGSATKIKEWATLYGSKAGVPVSDATFSERRKYRTELGSTSANSAGGQAKAFNQAVEHADGLATQLEKLNNYDPVGISFVGHTLNSIRQLGSTQGGIVKEAERLGQTLAGEVGKLFSGSAGGGVHERELTRKAFDTVSTPKELAGALRGTLETMEGGLRALEQRRDQVLGPNHNVELVNAETQKKIVRIREVISRLEGGHATPAAAPSGKTGSGVSWSIVQ